MNDNNVIRRISYVIGFVGAVWASAAVLSEAWGHWYTIPATVTAAVFTFVIVGFVSACALGWDHTK